MKIFNKEKMRTNDADKYKSLFIKESDAPPARFGKSVYIRKEHHERISQIVHVAGNGDVTLFGYIDNVLTQHFKQFQDEIVQSFNEKRIY
jgi:hypothetical protein